MEGSSDTGAGAASNLIAEGFLDNLRARPGGLGRTKRPRISRSQEERLSQSSLAPQGSTSQGSTSQGSPYCRSPNNGVALMRSASPIQTMSPECARNVRMGQAILDAASVIKELVENSLDAGATRIEVRVRGKAGTGSISVSDNGSGVDAASRKQLCRAHSTSKICSFEALDNVDTYGFRGEALSAIASLADSVCITTRTCADSVGAQLVFDTKGDLIKSGPAPRPAGTTVVVAGLFARLPVRRLDAQRHSTRDVSRCVSVVNMYALIATSTRFELRVENEVRVLADVRGGASQDTDARLSARIRSILGRSQAEYMTSCSAMLTMESPVAGREAAATTHGNEQNKERTVRLLGFVSKANHGGVGGGGRLSGSLQFIYLNGRPVDMPRLTRAVNEAYRKSCLTSTASPAFVLALELDNERGVDVNLAPDKRTVAFGCEDRLIEAVRDHLDALWSPQGAKMIPYHQSVLDTTDGGGLVVRGGPKEKVSDHEQASGCASSVVRGVDPVERTAPREREQRGSQFRNALPAFEPKVSFDSVIESCVRGAVQSQTDERAVALEHPGDNDTDRRPGAPDPAETERAAAASTGVDSRRFAQSRPRGPTQRPRPGSNESASTVPAVGVGPEHRLPTRRKRRAEARMDHEAEPDRGTPVVQSHVDESRANAAMPSGRPLRDPGLSKLDFSLDAIRRKRRAGAAGAAQSAMLQTANRPDLADGFPHSISKSKSGPETDEQKRMAEAELHTTFQQTWFERLSVIGQFNLGFILCLLDGEHVFIVDQHASDEKANYEALWKTLTVDTQELYQPMPLNLSAEDELLVVENLQRFRAGGFDIEFRPNRPVTRRLFLVSQPSSKRTMFVKDDLRDIVADLREQTQGVGKPSEALRPPRVRAMIASRACRKSIMIGTSLSASEMTKVVRSLAGLEHPWTCPHGRPTMRHLLALNKHLQDCN